MLSCPPADLLHDERAQPWLDWLHSTPHVDAVHVRGGRVVAAEGSNTHYSPATHHDGVPCSWTDDNGTSGEYAMPWIHLHELLRDHPVTADGVISAATVTPARAPHVWRRELATLEMHALTEHARALGPIALIRTGETISPDRPMVGQAAAQWEHIHATCDWARLCVMYQIPIGSPFLEATIDGVLLRTNRRP